MHPNAWRHAPSAEGKNQTGEIKRADSLILLIRNFFKLQSELVIFVEMQSKKLRTNERSELYENINCD